MAKTKDRIWNFKTDDELIDRLKRASDETGHSAAQIVRDAVNEKLDKLANRFPEINRESETEQTATA